MKDEAENFRFRARVAPVATHGVQAVTTAFEWKSGMLRYVREQHADVGRPADGTLAGVPVGTCCRLGSVLRPGPAAAFGDQAGAVVSGPRADQVRDGGKPLRHQRLR